MFRRSIQARGAQSRRTFPIKRYGTQLPQGRPKQKPIQEDEATIDNPNAALQPPFQSPGGNGTFTITRSPTIDAAVTTVIGIAMVFFGGIAYFAWYKKNVLDKIEMAFQPGYDPALAIASHITSSHRDSTELSEEDAWRQHLRRREQPLVDRIICGEERGKYFLMMGPKGVGKGTMILDAMHDIKADGVAFCEAHPDLEVFRLRLGKALNFEFNEDTQTGLFQRRDPREAGPSLDIERALNKLEKVALKLTHKRGRPLVMIFNNVHLLGNSEEGRNILLQLQQRAEPWAGGGIMTMVFTTDEFWPFIVLRKTANRMQVDLVLPTRGVLTDAIDKVLSIGDLTNKEAVAALRQMRGKSHARVSPEQKATEAEQGIYRQVVELTGGRLAFLGKAAQATDMLNHTKKLLDAEKAWMLDHIGLIPDHDDDVMDEQKWSSCSWLLLQEFVKMRIEQEKEREEAISNGTVSDPSEELPLPVLPYWRCRQIMTRPDFLGDLDEKNLISIDVHSDVRPDSVLLLEAARQVVMEPGFEETLQNVRDRVDEIESLHRTRELTLKDFPALNLKNLDEKDTQELEKKKRDWLRGKSSWRSW